MVEGYEEIFFIITIYVMAVVFGGCAGEGRAMESDNGAMADAADITTDADGDSIGAMDVTGSGSEEDVSAKPAEGVSEKPGYENIANPLEGYNVSYPGEKLGDDPVTCQLIHKFIGNSGVPADEVLMVNVCDYERNGEYDAFILAGKLNNIDSGYEGSVYFVNDGGVELVDGDTTYWWDQMGGCIDYDKRWYAVLSDNISATEIFTHMWEVRDGKPQETDISRLGNIHKDDNGDIVVSISMYDGSYEDDIDGYTGHTYKPYYFYYDENKDCIVEYGGKELAPDEINDICGNDVVSYIESLGNFKVTEGFLRENGILNINYYNEWDGGKGYFNCNYNANTQRFIPAYDNEETIKGSDFGGTYFATSGAKCPVTYPK